MSGDIPDPPYGTTGRLELDELEDRLLECTKAIAEGLR
jgi:hypothetical protein